MPRKVDHEEMVDKQIIEKSREGYKRVYEIPDPTPMQPPLGWKRQPSLIETVRDMVRSEQLRQLVEADGQETFEEADDFIVDEYDPSSPYEENFDPVEALRQRRLDEQAIRAEADRRDQEALDQYYKARGVTPPPPPPEPPSPAPKAKKKAAPAADQDDD